MKIEYLVGMANDIGAFFAADADSEAAASAVASHLRRFWEPRMRAQIVAHQAQGGVGMSDLARKAVGLLAAESQQA